MSDKKCKDCKHFEVDTVSAVCEKKRWICDDDAPACNRFDPIPKMTNGDKIRQGGNRAMQNSWTVGYQEDNEDGLNDIVEQRDLDNPATAALKLWLELKGENK